MTTTSQAKRPRKPAKRTVNLGDSKTIADAAALQTRLQALLERSGPVVLDAAKLARVDTAALQVLAAFMEAADAARLSVSWKQPGAPVIEASQRLGLQAKLGLDKVR